MIYDFKEGFDLGGVQSHSSLQQQYRAVGTYWDLGTRLVPNTYDRLLVDLILTGGVDHAHLPKQILVPIKILTVGWPCNVDEKDSDI